MVVRGFMRNLLLTVVGIQNFPLGSSSAWNEFREFRTEAIGKANANAFRHRVEQGEKGRDIREGGGKREREERERGERREGNPWKK